MYYEGVVSERPIEERDVFLFNVLGLSGKFFIYKDYLDNKLKVKIVESNAYCSIEILKGTGSPFIDAFEITDKQGYKYVLDVKNNIQDNPYHRVITGPPAGTTPDCPYYLQNVSPSIGHLNQQVNNLSNIDDDNKVYFYTEKGINKNFWKEMSLSKIYDPNGQLILNINYQGYYKSWVDATFAGNMFGGITSMERFIMKSIDLYNVGVIEFENTLVRTSTSKYIITNMEVKDLRNNLIKSVKFDYDSSNNNSSIGYDKVLLTQISDFNNTASPLKTQLFYKPFPLYQGANGADPYFGYLASKGYYREYLGGTNFISDLHALQKIKFPTGGSVLFKFGPHTSKYPTEEENKMYNLDNQSFTPITPTPNAGVASSFTFNVTGNDRVFITHSFDSSRPLFLHRIVGTTKTLIATIYSKEKYDYMYRNHRKVNSSDNVYEWSFRQQLTAGTYELSSTQNFNAQNFKILRMNYKPAANIKNFVYKEGVRIDEIAYFKDDVSQNLLENLGTVLPEKYTFFDYHHEGFALVTAYIDAIVNSKGIPFYKIPLFEPYYFYRKVTVQNRGVGKKENVYVPGDIYRKIAQEHLYDANDNLIEEKVYNRERASDYIQLKDLRMVISPFEKKTTETKKIYEKGSMMQHISVTDYHNTYHQPSSVLITSPLGKVEKIEFDYERKGQRLVNTQARNYVNNSLTDQILNTYDTAGNIIKTEFKTPEMTAYEKVGNENTLYNNGLLTGYTQADGTPITLVYGYNNTQVVAKVVNVEASAFYGLNFQYQQIRTSIANYSNQNSSNYHETNLKNTLNGLKTTFPNAMVTTYTYKPMVGISSITDENGKITTYEYDTFNRLKTVKDYLGNILKEYQYNFTN